MPLGGYRGEPECQMCCDDNVEYSVFFVVGVVFGALPC